MKTFWLIIVALAKTTSCLNLKDNFVEDLNKNDHENLEFLNSDSIKTVAGRILEKANASVHLPYVNIASNLCLMTDTRFKHSQLAGNTEIRNLILSKTGEIETEVSTKFLDIDGTFVTNATFRIQNLTLQGSFTPNNTIILYFISSKIPETEFEREGEFFATLNDFEMKINFLGIAPPNKAIELEDVTFSIDWGNANLSFNTLRIKSTEGPPGRIVWFSEFRRPQEVPNYISWYLKKFYQSLGLQGILEIGLKCNLQHILKDCTLMDLLVSDDCLNMELLPECLQDKTYNVTFDESLEKRNFTMQPMGPCYPGFSNLGEDGVDFRQSKVDVSGFDVGLDDVLLQVVTTSLKDFNGSSERRQQTVCIFNGSNNQLPSTMAQVMWNGRRMNYIFGGYLKTWDNYIRDFKISDESLITQFLEDEKTFWINYTLGFNFINVSGEYNTDMTFYTDHRGQGESLLFGDGDYDWNLPNLTIKVDVQGFAPSTGFISIPFVNITVSINGDRKPYLTFTNMKSAYRVWNGTIVDLRLPLNWLQLPDAVYIKEFLYDNEPKREGDADYFFEEVANHFQCALNKALAECTLLDLIIDDKCMNVNGLENCYSGSVATVGSPEFPTTTSLPPTTTTDDDVTNVVTEIWTTSTTDSPDIPTNIRLLLNQTQVLLKQAQFLLQLAEEI